MTTNPDLEIPEAYRRKPGEAYRRKPGDPPTRSIMARPSTAAPTPSKTLQAIAKAERDAIEADLAEKADLAKHGKAET